MNWLKLVNKTIICTVIILSLNNSFAQKKLEDYKKSYPDYSELIIKDYQQYAITTSNNKLKIISNNDFESIILNENGISNNEENFSYSDLIKLVDYNAVTINNVKGKDKVIKVTQTNEKGSNGGSVFHDGVKTRQLIFPNLEPGSKKSYQYETEITDSFLLHKFIFGNSYPIEKATLEVIVDNNINIGYSVFHDPNNLIEFNKTEKKGKTIYSWSLKNIKPYKFEYHSPGILYELPNINVYIKDYTLNNKTTPVLGSVDRLYDYYKSFIDQTNKIESEDLKNVSLEITKNQTTDLEKIKTIFYWVKENINYIAFEEGYEGFIPREPALVFERKYGDCKDMATLINAMAKYANVKNVYYCWIGTRKIPYTYKELSTPSVDNHMIALYKDNGKNIFLDATDQQTRFGIPTSFIQGKEALVGNGDQYEIVKVPIVDAVDNKLDELVNLKIDSNKLIGNGWMEFNGYNRTNLIYDIADTKDKARYDYIKSVTIKGNNKFKLIDYTEENLKDKDKPYIINFNFEIDNYILKVDNEIYVNLFLDRNFEKFTIEKDRASKYDFEFLTDSNANYVLEIPTNYKVKLIPKDFILNNNLLSAKFTFKQEKNKITLYANIIQKKMLLEKEDFDLWNESVQKIKKNYSETIILEKI